MGGPSISEAPDDGRGGSTRYSSVDIGDADALSRAIADAESGWGGPVDGIIHVADETRPRSLLALDESDFRAGLRAKLDGMAAVSRILEERPECHFLGFSSAVSLLGAAGLATYAGANASLELAAAAIPGGEGVTRMTVAWPPLRMRPRLDHGWEETFEANPRFFEATESMTPSRAWDYLLAILQTGEPAVFAGLDEASPAVRQLSPGETVAAEEVKAYFISEDPGSPSWRTHEMDLADPFGVLVPVSATPVSELPEILPGFRLATPRDPEGWEGRFVAPRNSIERRLARLWASILNLEKVGIEDHFFDLGGNSLIATQLVSRIRTSFGVDLPLRAVFAAPTVDALSLEILERQASSLDSQELASLLAILEEEA
jgi:acyl carrier protein